jgi:hypothetical protein
VADALALVALARECVETLFLGFCLGGECFRLSCRGVGGLWAERAEVHLHDLGLSISCRRLLILLVVAQRLQMIAHNCELGLALRHSLALGLHLGVVVHEEPHGECLLKFWNELTGLVAELGAKVDQGDNPGPGLR